MSWSFDLVLQEVANVHGSRFATKHAIGNAATLYILAGIGGGISVFFDLGIKVAGIEAAVEGLFLIDPNYGTC
jgi:hypothetical protein